MIGVKCFYFLPDCSHKGFLNWQSSETERQTCERGEFAVYLYVCPSVTSAPGPMLLPMAMAIGLNFTCGS